MQLVDHPFVKFDHLKPVYNFTYPLFRTISDKFRGYINYSKLIDYDKVPRARSVSLYLHVPFCETICSFCPFQKGAFKHTSQIDDYTDALVREISIKGNFVRSLGGRIRTIYIGGGSPSVLSMEPSSLAHRQVLRLFSDTVLRECGYAPCNGHSYIRDANCGLLNLAGMCSADNFRYHKYLHGYHDDYVVGFGASAQSILGPLITRANPNRSDYIADTREHGAPKVHYNWAPTRQSASKALCMRLPYSGYVAKERIDWRNVDPFVRENLRHVIKAGLVVEDEHCMQLTRTGWQWYSGLMFYLLPQADRAVLDDYVAEMLNAPAVLDGATEVFTAA
ncbi:hypothetical protein F9K85_11170 [Brucella tritici]|uniref:Coproporphyrinogen III oxidase n=1 Tax=Brucella tritici TaxID=94626 RepID=A0A6L3Y3U4_9HYPH|nr:hypothetical protein [Brucella tritici]KAB2675379.1 hypothetical protein F9L08_27785 [Brucella tritici]KAB2676496.1 hypothetical protein F9K85_11170 [Brucella tritici]